MAVANGAPVRVDDVVFQRGMFSGRAEVQLPAPDLARQPHRTLLWLRLQDGRLSGYAAAMTTTRRAYYALSSYIRLERTAP